MLKSWLPVIIITGFVFCSIFLDGISAYDVPLPFGWLSDTESETLNAGCSMFDHPRE